MSEPDPALQVHRVSKTFGGVRALIDVDFELRPGEIHCLAGENGSGKSTLIKIVSGVYQPEPGAEIQFAGRPVTGLSPGRARALGVQVIWQDLALFPHLSVAENIAFERNLGARPALSRRAELYRLAAASLARLGFELPLAAAVGELSIAQRQLVAIARALVANARIVFMDEPTASLTQAETKRLFAVVEKLSADGIAVIFVSHRLVEVMQIAERVTVLRDGRLVGTFASEDISQAELAHAMTGQHFDTQPRARDRSDQPIVLEVAGLSRRGEFEAIDLRIRAGEIVGLTGLLGAGRTELATTLFGLVAPDEGEIRVDGQAVRFRSNRDAVRAGIAYVPEDRLNLGLIDRQTIADNVVISVLKRLTGALGMLMSDAKVRLVGDWIDRLKVRIGATEDAVATLSGGNQQRVVLAKWLATEPKVLILDSPTVGVDVGARAGIFAIVRELAAAGKAILLISDEIPEVYANADRVLHMDHGRLKETYIPGRDAMARIEQAVHG